MCPLIEQHHTQAELLYIVFHFLFHPSVSLAWITPLPRGRLNPCVCVCWCVRPRHSSNLTGFGTCTVLRLPPP